MVQRDRDYVDAAYLEEVGKVLTALKKRIIELMAVVPGERVLDVGCGPGIDTVQLANTVGAAGAVYGLDYDPDMLDAAARRSMSETPHRNALYLQGDGACLPFGDASFDACRSERVLQHIAQPDRFVTEIARVVRPGGRIVLADIDFSTMSIDTDLTDIEWRIRRWAVERLRNGMAGRQLNGLLHRAGLEITSLDLVPLKGTHVGTFCQVVEFERTAAEAIERGFVGSDEVDRLLADMHSREQAGTFFVSGIVVIAAGRKPHQ
jgi:ubiquinone/menaquinone biosynthesis C-methylase UbiE